MKIDNFVKNDYDFLWLFYVNQFLFAHFLFEITKCNVTFQIKWTKKMSSTMEHLKQLSLKLPIDFSLKNQHIYGIYTDNPFTWAYIWRSGRCAFNSPNS